MIVNFLSFLSSKEQFEFDEEDLEKLLCFLKCGLKNTFMAYTKYETKIFVYKELRAVREMREM
jgi:hypothetical protein